MLMPSTPSAYPQVASRPFASFRVIKSIISAAQAVLCAWFDSRQLHQKGRRSGSCRGHGPVGGASLRYIRNWRCHCGGDNPSRTCDAAIVSGRAAKRPVPRRIPALSGRTSAHRATAPSAFRPRRLPGRIAPAINPQPTEEAQKEEPACASLVPPHNSRCDESTCRRNNGYRKEQRNQMCRSERPHIATSGPSSA